MRGPNTGGHEGDSKLRKKARQPRGPRMSLYWNLLGASRYSRHPRGATAGGSASLHMCEACSLLGATKDGRAGGYEAQVGRRGLD